MKEHETLDGKSNERTNGTFRGTRRTVLKSAGAFGAIGLFLTNVDVVSSDDTRDHLVETPPMGWNSWNHFGCDIDEDLIKDVADAMVETGLRDAGYEYLNIDDCWMAPERDEDGNLQPDPDSFPNGIDAVADYVHERGLKLGIYSSAGTKTCQGLPASLGHEEADAQSFADWGVDYLKYDNCYNQGVDARKRYTAMSDALDATDRDIVYSICCWGQYDVWKWADDIGGNLWRTTGDITDDWARIMDILDQQVGLAQYAEPGHWNDPDMLEVGNDGISLRESRAHFSLWCLLAAPLLAGNDVRDMSEDVSDILMNEAALAINQDPAGVQGTKRTDDGTEEVWAKPLENGDVAVALLNRDDTTRRISTDVETVGLDEARPNAAYVLHEIWTDAETATANRISAAVPSHGVAFYRIRPGTPNEAPPATTFVLGDDDAFVNPGETETVTATFTNDGRLPARDVTFAIDSSDGWTVTTCDTTTGYCVPPGESVETTWTVAVPDGVDADTYEFDATASFTWGGNRGAATESVLSLMVPPSPPTSDAYVSDLDWMSTINGWGPVERDMSVGEQAEGDGGTITIDGQTYEKGLGCHAHSEVTYYLGGNCSRFRSDVGVDDEVGDRGSVAFQVFGDGEKLYETDPVTGAMAPTSVDVDIGDVDVLKLVITTGDGGKNYDHADWAGARVLV